MKKFLLIPALLLSLSFVQAQVCTPDPLATAPLLTPSSVDTLYATVNQPYSQVFTINVPADTTVNIPAIPPLFPGGPATLTILKQSVSSIDSMPSTFTYACNIATCTWLGGSSGCIKLSGTPTQIGNYRMSINVNTQADPFLGVTIPIQPLPVPYFLKVTGPIAVDNVLDVNAFRFAACQPSPAQDMTTLKFSYSSNKNLEMNVIDLAGRTILSENIQANPGINTQELNLQNLTSGIYIVTLNDGVRTLKQKLVVQ